MDKQNNSFTPTYSKRARQLVKKGRAVWLDKSTICLTQPEEEYIMKPEKMEQEQAQTMPAVPVFDDALLQELAKRRLAIKHGLIGQIFDFALLALAVICMVNLYNWSDRVFVGIGLMLFWAIRLGWRWFKFMQPSFKEGVASYFRKRKERQLAFECDRLKSMSTEYVTNELSR